MFASYRSYRIAIIVILTAAFCIYDCRAALPTTTGSERKLWDEGGYAVIVAKVEEILELGQEDRLKNHATHTAALVPLATIAGTLDPSTHRKLLVTLNIGSFTTSVDHAPPRGAWVLAVIEPGPMVAADICTFMPDNAGLVVIDGPADKRVAETLKRIQEAREKGSAEEKKE
jgi:hypothetical protein